MVCYNILCYVESYHVVLGMLCYVVLCGVVLGCTMVCVVLMNVVLCYVILYCFIFYLLFLVYTVIVHLCLQYDGSMCLFRSNECQTS